VRVPPLHWFKILKFKYCFLSSGRQKKIRPKVSFPLSHISPYVSKGKSFLNRESMGIDSVCWPSPLSSLPVSSLFTPRDFFPSALPPFLLLLIMNQHLYDQACPFNWLPPSWYTFFPQCWVYTFASRFFWRRVIIGFRTFSRFGRSLITTASCPLLS